MIHQSAFLDTVIGVGAVLNLLDAAWSDWKTRTANNGHWVLLAATGILIPLTHPTAWVTVALGTLYCIGAWKGGMGGADAKALLASSLLFPNPILYSLLVLTACLATAPWFFLYGKTSKLPFLIPLATSLSVGLILQTVHL